MKHKKGILDEEEAEEEEGEEEGEKEDNERKEYRRNKKKRKRRGENSRRKIENCIYNQSIGVVIIDIFDAK